MEFYHKELSYKVIGLAMEVHRKLGGGFLEKVYRNALLILLEREGIKAVREAPMNVYFENQLVGEFHADVLVEDCLILELKAVETLLGIHRAQTVNYLKSAKLRAAYLINFGKQSLEYERFVN
jgi:GxxExxY protein